MTTPHTAPRTALFLIGSAKPAGASSSESLGTYLMERLAQRGVTTEIYHVAHVMRTEARIQAFLTALDHTDLFVLAYPLYVDSPPYLVVEVLERIAAHRQAQSAPTPANFLAIANCGFPEARHNATSLAICEQFAAEAGFHWTGGLALGEGGVIHGQTLAKAGGIVHNVVATLDQVAAALATGIPLPADAAAHMAQPLMPDLAYMLVGDLGWLMEARRHRVLTRLGARPFQKT